MTAPSTPGTPAAFRVVQEGADTLGDYARIPIRFTVASRFRVDPVDAGLGGLSFREEPVAPPYVKDYDRCEGEGPATWATRWDLSNWAVLAVFAGPERVGGAVVAWKTEGVDMLEGRTDLAVLWDIRVAPDWRRSGVGRALFAASEAWARERGCRTLKVETQNVNVPACRFYAGNGCRLGAVHLHAYPEFPDEARLLWYKDLSPPG